MSHPKNPRLGSLLFLLSLSGFVFPASAQNGPTYATAETQQVVERMIEAHGGLDRWRATPSVRYENIFFNPFAEEGDNPWWISIEVTEQGRRRAYQDWPHLGSTLVYDGHETWTTNWGNDNPPAFMATMFYYFLNLPWLSQDDGVVLGEVEEGSLPGFDKTYHVVSMTYNTAPTVGKTIHDFYRLFIDPDTYVLQGYEYGIGYGALLDAMGLPPEMDVMGPVLRIHDEMTWADGLLVPSRMHTMAPDGSTTWGHHALYNYSFSTPFDATRLQKPADAVVDTSSPERGAGG